MTALFALYFSTLPVLLTAFLINDIITAQQNSFDADTLDGCLHFLCKFNHRAERTLTLGDLDNQNLERRSAIDQRPFAHAHLYLENLILPGGIKTCEPQKETREQFRYSATHHWINRPVHTSRYYRLLRNRGRPAAIPRMESNARSGTDGRKE